jgi:hypothetical protein
MGHHLTTESTHRLFRSTSHPETLPFNIYFNIILHLHLDLPGLYRY